VSAIWALITLIPQVIDLHLFSIDHHWPMLLLERFFFILPITLVFDIRDIQSDPESLLTLPKLIGSKGTKFLAAISLFIGYYFLLHLNLSKEIIISMAVLYMLMFLSILYANEKRDELYFSGYMDALMGVHALVILFFYWI
jgi:1,4-dihydroxy-2-naphthoate octaprenyltransferase